MQQGREDQWKFGPMDQRAHKYDKQGSPREQSIKIGVNFGGENISNQKNIQKLERYPVERIPLPGWTVYILYSTDRLVLDADLNQNIIGLFLSPTKLIHQVLL